MCTYQTTTLAVRGQWEGRPGLVPGVRRHRLLRSSRPRQADHTLNIDLRNPSRGASARVAVELDAGSARALAEAILETLASVPAALISTPAAHQA